MSPHAAQALELLAELMGARRHQHLHDAWTLRELFASSHGPWRRAGFATRVLVRAASAEMDRVGTRPADPLDEAFWLLAEQQRYLNFDVVEERAVRMLFAEMSQLRVSQQRAAQRLLLLRTANRGHPAGRPASNLLLLAVLAGGMEAIEGAESFRNAIASRFPDGLPYLPGGEARALLLPDGARLHLDQQALAIDRAARARHGG